MSAPVIRRDSPLAEDVRPLLERHLALMRASSPPESCHPLDADGLSGPDVAFFTLRMGAAVLGMGALKRLSPDAAEIKSMHVVAEARGRGLSRLLLAHLLDEAARLGLRTINLETGSQPVFAPARALYLAAGFAECGPFADYTLDPYSVYMTRAV